MKHEYKKHEKELYGTKAKPVLLDVPRQKYICIKGEGNPNGEDFKKRVEALYSLAYTIRMSHKNGFAPDDYFEYTVYPLEGLWDKKNYDSKELHLDDLMYTIMIRQPEFVDEAMFKKAMEVARNKKRNELLSEIYFDEIADGLSVQMLHIGPFATESETFSVMREFIENNNLHIKTLVHREIYLSDPRKVAGDRLKTLLRYRVEKNE
ncbi:GyrI-like domain-containing protein [Solibacillus sp. FSL W7-1464]|uniref:GyrI-like domain-containing protein n=1 Tax=Solibacillus sp. FSL W7-1464 TaxID=2921706 RepID=UPI0030F5A3CF